MKLLFDHSEKLSPLASSFWFKAPENVQFQAGQFLELYLNDLGNEERDRKRWFTVSSSPSELPMLSITTKLFTPHSNFKQRLTQLKKDEEVEIIEPSGDFVLPKDPEIPLIFVAGGIGITPFHSIIKFLNDNHEIRNISLLYGVSDPSEIVFDELFKSYMLSNYVVVVESPNDSWNGEKGRITPERIFNFAGGQQDPFIYISGPEAMVESLNDSLKGLGIPENRLVGDYFPNYEHI